MDMRLTRRLVAASLCAVIILSSGNTAKVNADDAVAPGVSDHVSLVSANESTDTSEEFRLVSESHELFADDSDDQTTLGRRLWAAPRWERRTGNDGVFPIDGDLDGVSFGWRSRNADSLFLSVEGVIMGGGFDPTVGGKTDYEEWQIEGLLELQQRGQGRFVGDDADSIGGSARLAQRLQQVEAAGFDQNDRHRQAAFQVGAVGAGGDDGVARLGRQASADMLHRLLKAEADRGDDRQMVELEADIPEQIEQAGDGDGPDHRFVRRAGRRDVIAHGGLPNESGCIRCSLVSVMFQICRVKPRLKR